MTFEKSESGLVRSLSLKDSVMIGVASMIGGAIFCSGWTRNGSSRSRINDCIFA